MFEMTKKIENANQDFGHPSTHQQPMELLDVKSLTSKMTTSLSSLESSPNLSFLQKPIDYSSNSESDFEFEKLKANTENSKYALEIVKDNHTLIPHNGAVILSQPVNDVNDPCGPKIGKVSVQNASDVTFGNKTFYQGPVTIKQIVVSGSDETESNDKISTQYHVKLVKFAIHYKRTILVILTILAVCLLTSLTVLNKVYQWNNSPPTPFTIPWRYPLPNPLENPVNGLMLVKRHEWHAIPPTEEILVLNTPVNRTVIYHAVTNSCYKLSDCIFEMQKIQIDHIERNFDDVGYNFLVAGDGRAYVGRGWDFVGAHNPSQNKMSIGIAFLGTFTSEFTIPPERQFIALKKLLAEGVRLKKLTPDYIMIPHKCFAQTKSPGDGVMNKIKNWSNYFQNVPTENVNCTYVV